MIARGNPDASDFSRLFVLSGGSNAGISLTTRTSPDSDLDRELSEGRVKVHTETDRLPLY